MRNQKTINLIAAMSSITVLGFALGMIYPALSLIMESKGISPDVIGINTSIQPLGTIITLFLTARFVSKFGAVRVAGVCAFMISAIILTYPHVSIFWTWFFLRFFQGFFFTTLFSISEAWVIKYSGGSYASRILSVYMSLFALAMAAGPFLIAQTGLDGTLPFDITASVIAVAAIPIFLVRSPASEEAGTFSVLSITGFFYKAPLLLSAVGIFALSEAAALSFLPVFGILKGLPQEQAALLVTAFVGGPILLQYPVGWLSDRFNKGLVLAGCSLVTAASLAAIPLLISSSWIWIDLALAGSASAGLYTLALAILGEKFSGLDILIGTSAFSAIYGVGLLVGSIACGLIMEALGADTMFYALAVVFVVFLFFQFSKIRAAGFGTL
jgi:MFS family permease